MVGIGTLLAVLVVLFWLARWRGIDLRERTWFLWAVVASGPLAVIALEAGWVATAVGRQPWTVWQVLRTNDAANPSSWLWLSFAATLLVYIAMTVGAFVVLRSMARRWRAGDEDLPSPYGPGSAPPHDQALEAEASGATRVTRARGTRTPLGRRR